MKSTFVCKENILLENGETLISPEITFHTYGKMNESKSNVVWVFHALTANSDAEDWWNGLIGEARPDDLVGRGKLFYPKKIFYCLCEYFRLLLRLLRTTF